MPLNLLTNPSFETGPVGSPPPGWSVVGTLGGSATSQADSSAFDGFNDAVLSVATDTDFVRLFQKVAIPLGTTNFTVAYAVRAVEPLLNGRARARILYFDALDTQIGFEIVQTVAAAHLTDPAWETHVGVSGAVPLLAASAQLELTLGGEVDGLGDVVVDAVVFIAT